MKPQRGICPVCKEERAVTFGGGMRNHLGYEYVGRLRQNCTGEGKVPERIVDPIGEAEQCGYDRAITDLRAEAARSGDSAYDFAADWLESRGEE